MSLTNANCDDGSGGADPFAVEITSPTDTIYTRDSVTIQVAVTGGTAERLELLRDGSVLVTLEAPYQYGWDTSGEEEGGHELTARAVRAQESVVSEPRVVIVDRTAPAVTVLTPVPGDDQVWVRAPIRASFSEAILGASVTEDAVVLSGEGGPLASTPSLSVDGLTLTVEPNAPLAAPESVAVELGTGITDLAGNPLAPLADPWTFQLPAWLHVGEPLDEVDGEQSDAFNALLELDGSGAPVVAWSESLPGTATPTIQVARWDGTAWSSFAEMDPATEVSMTLADGMPLLARSRDEATDAFVRVERWSGADWTPVGSDLGVQPLRPAYSPSIESNAAGNAIVAWSEYADGTQSDNVYVRRHNGVDWEPLGTLVSANSLPDTHARYPDVVVGPGDRLLVAWTEEVKPGEPDIYIAEWNGSSWPLLGTPLDAVSYAATWEPTLCFVGEEPLLAWREDDYVFVRRWNGSSWLSLGGPQGDANEVTQPRRPSLAQDLDGSVIVAWSERSPTGATISVTRWNGDAWEPVGGGTLSSGGSTLFDSPSLEITPSGDIYLAVEDRGATSAVHLFQLNQ